MVAPDASMTTGKKDPRPDRLVRAAKELGADEAKIVDTERIVVDERVRLKCLVPVCDSYGRHLMCPPNLMSVKDFAQVLRRYRKALILQVEADYDSYGKAGRHLSKRTCDELERATNTREWKTTLHELVNRVEAAAFKEGYYLAAGLIGGSCALCPECVSHQSGEPCRRPFEARPSMEAMGIDVLKTCENAGLPLSLSSKEKVRWTGLVLLD